MPGVGPVAEGRPWTRRLEPDDLGAAFLAGCSATPTPSFCAEVRQACGWHPLLAEGNRGRGASYSAATEYALYLSRRRTGFFRASRRNGSPSSWVTMTSSTVARSLAAAWRSASPI
jgi:hypothetical protein